jgi:hypothetical protein
MLSISDVSLDVRREAAFALRSIIVEPDTEAGQHPHILAASTGVSETFRGAPSRSITDEQRGCSGEDTTFLGRSPWIMGTSIGPAGW